MASLDREVDRLIAAENRRAINPETVRCPDCGETVEPTRIAGQFFDPPGTTIMHRCVPVSQP